MKGKTREEALEELQGSLTADQLELILPHKVSLLSCTQFKVAEHCFSPISSKYYLLKVICNICAGTR